MAKTLKPFINISPGRIITRNMEALNWNNKDLAEILGMPEKTVSLLVNGKQSITVNTAILLGKAFGTSPEFWMSLEQNYRLRLKKEGKRERDTEIRAAIRKHLPIAEMRKKGWIDCGRSADSQMEAVRKFWNVEVMNFSMYEKDSLPFCARQGKTDETYTRFYSITWFQKAKTEAAFLKAPKYSETKLVELSRRLKELSRGEDPADALISGLNGAGVKFFVLSHLSKTFLDGASFHDGKNPVIVYTGRHNRIDNFWWTMAHEMAHVLLHLKDGSSYFLDNLDDRTGISGQEKKADELAAELLGAREVLAKAEPYKQYISEARLLEISGVCGLNPSVALGILQYGGYADYRTLPRYRKPVLDRIRPDLIRG